MPSSRERRARAARFERDGWGYLQPSGLVCRRCLCRETFLLRRSPLIREQRLVYCPACCASWSASDLPRQLERQRRLRERMARQRARASEPGDP